MKKSFLFIIIFTLFFIGTKAQVADWNAVLPAYFPTNVSGQIHGLSRCSQMKFNPSDSNKVYVVSARGGLFISNDGGNNYHITPGTDFMSSVSFASVCIDFTNDSIIYLGTGDANYYSSGSGVLKSTNGGLTYTYDGLSGKLVVEMIMDPLDHTTIVAATNSGIYKTTNSGSTWTLKTASRAFDDLKLKAANSRTLYAATRDSAFFRSTDFGNTWTQITSGIILPTGITNGNGCRVAVTPADTNVVYLGMVANSGTIYKSTNGGTSFTGMKTTASPYITYYDNNSTSSGQGDYNFDIGVDRTNANILYLVAHNNWKSLDGGLTWTQLTNWWEKCHTDMHQIFTNPYNNLELYNVNDGGIFVSTDGGNNWSPKSNGVYGYEIYHGNCSPTRKDMISIGTQDNGELYANTSGWFTNRGGDWGSQCAFDYRSNSSMVYYFENNNRRLVNGNDATYGLPVTSLQDIAFRRSNPNLAFAANNNIYRTTNLLATTPTWTQISTFSKTIMAAHSSLADSNRLYVITNDAMIYVSNNALSASPTFTSYTLPSATNNKATITTIKSNPNVIYITANTQVYRSGDNGATWTNIKYNLPSVNHARILSDEYFSSNELVLIASGNAVYYKNGPATSWTIYNDSLPTRTTIEDMSIFNDSTANTVLRVAMYGRGMWETPINNLRSLTANFAANNTNPCIGETITYSDLSTGTVLTRNWSFPGGTPSTSTLQNPTVTYNTSGVFNSKLVVTSTTGFDSMTRTAYVSTIGAPLPLVEGFEGNDDPPLGWKNIDNGTQGDEWAKTSTAGGYGNSGNSMMFDNYSWNIPGEKDELQARRVDISGYNSLYLKFDVAYQVFSGYSDTLRVLVSTDCGNTFTPVYTKGGTVLSTAGSAGNNYVPAPNEWRTDSVNLNSFLGNSDMIIEFQNINGYGNKLYIDNVNINATVPANAGLDQTVCRGTPVNLGGSSSPFLTYSWSPTTGLNAANISNPIATPTATQTYTLTTSQINSSIQNSDTITVNVNQPPVANGGSYPTQCFNGPILNLAGTPIGGLFYGIGVNANSFNPAIAGVGMDTVFYVATGTNGCSDTDKVLINVIVCSGIENVISSNCFTIMPNPAHDLITILFNETIQNGGVLRVFDASGKEVIHTQYSSLNKQHQLELNISNLASGIYEIVINSGNKFLKGRFVKQ